MIITDLFKIEIAKSYNLNQLNEIENGVNYVSRTKKNNGVSALVEKLEDMKMYPKGTITVPLVGNSTMMASLQLKEYCCSQNIAVLTPLVDMSDAEKMFYSVFIQKQKDNFSYGRNGHSRISELDIPPLNRLPEWVNKKSVKEINDMKQPKAQSTATLPSTSDWKIFTYEELFTIQRGQGPTATNAKKNPGANPYVGASAENNGITQYTSIDACHSGNVLTVSNNGSIGETFYQQNDFLASSDVCILTPKFNGFNPQVGLFIATLIKKEKYKFNYGRKWGIERMRKHLIKVPVTQDGNIDVELITKYINSLSYSKYL